MRPCRLLPFCLEYIQVCMARRLPGTVVPGNPVHHVRIPSTVQVLVPVRCTLVLLPLKSDDQMYQNHVEMYDGERLHGGMNRQMTATVIPSFLTPATMNSLERVYQVLVLVLA